MDNYFKWFGICIDSINILQYGASDKSIELNPGDLIKISPQCMPGNDDIHLIRLFTPPTSNDSKGKNENIYLCSNSKYETVDESDWFYLIVETNPSIRFNVYRKLNDIRMLEVGEMINIYINSSHGELKVCCKIEYIGEVPEYGKGVYFCLRTMENFEFEENRQTWFIGNYAKGSPTNLILVTASAFFEVIEIDDITSRPVVCSKQPSPIQPMGQMEILQAKLNALKIQISKGNPLNNNLKGVIRQDSHEADKPMRLQFNSVPLTCSICRKDCPISSGILLANCGHIVCYDCLIKHIKSTTDDIHFCPFINKTYKCNSIIQFYEIESLNSDETKTLINKKRNNRDTSVRSPTKRNVWNCNQCTYENNLNANNCEMCKSPKTIQRDAQHIQCINCFDYCDQANIFMVPKCTHNVCNNCLMVYLEYQLKGDVDAVNCPIKFCDNIMKQKEILDMFIQLDQFIIKNRMNWFGVCIGCQVVHPNITCKQFQHNLSLSNDPVSARITAKYNQLVATGVAATCPKCKLVIIKQGDEKEYCINCEMIFEPETYSKRWQCGICCNSNDRVSNICKTCGKEPKTKTGSSISKANCMFCTLEVKFDDGVVLNCSHFFCKSCLESLVRTNEPVVKCPYERNNNKCMIPIEEYEIKQIMGNHMYKQYKIRLIRDVAKETENSVLCLDKNCPGWTLKDDLHDSNLFICTVCHQPNCLSCEAVHAGMTCAVYNDPAKRAQFLKPKPKQYDDLVKMDADQVITNTEPFECPICYMDFGVGEAVVLRECLHVFCKPCLTNHVTHTDGVEAKCPFQDNNYQCDSIILEREIKAIVDPKTYERYIEKWYTIGKNNIELGVQCQTVNCNGFWENDGNINEQECPLCKAINCLNCKAIHPDMKCDEYQTSNETKKKLEEEIAQGIGMRCPKCKIIIVRSSGCDWLQCTMCRTEICWVTKGPRWGPKGHGDSSGGCKCRVNGRKCHPNCMNCH